MFLLFASLPNSSPFPEPAGNTPSAWLVYLLLWAGIILVSAGLSGWLWMRLRRRRQAGEKLSGMLGQWLAAYWEKFATRSKREREAPTAPLVEIVKQPAETTAPAVEPALERPDGWIPAWAMPLIEVAILCMAVGLYCQPLLNSGVDRHLPGMEAEVFQVLDWTLVHSVREAHQFPLWNPYLGSGLPYISDPMLHVYQPFATLPVLLFGVQTGFRLAVALSFLLAALGMRQLGKILGMGPMARVWVALMYAFAGQPVAHFFQGQYLFVIGFAWIPWSVAGLFLAVRTHRRLHICLAALALALLFFSGNLYYSFFMVGVVGLFAVLAIFKIYRRRPYVTVDLRRTRTLAAIGLLTLGLIAVQLLPLFQLSPYINRVMAPIGSHTPFQVLLDYTSRDTLRPDAYKVMPAREEFYAYVGWWPFLGMALLPFVSWSKNRRTLVFFALLGVGVLCWINLDGMPWFSIYTQIPLLLQFRHLLRILILGSFVLIVLAGMGLDATWKLLSQADVADGAGAASDADVASAAGQPATPVAHTRRARLRAALVLVGQIVVGGMMLAGVIDLYRTNGEHVVTTPIDADLHQAANWLREYDLGNYNAAHNPFNGGYDAMAASGLRFVNAWYHFSGPFDANYDSRQRAIQAQPVYMLRSTKAPQLDLPDITLLTQVGNYAVYQLPHSLPFAFSVADDVLYQGRETGPLQSGDVLAQTAFCPGPNTIEVIASSDGNETMVVLTSLFPGWQVSVDGQPSLLLNLDGYLGVKMEPGIHQYTFSFSSWVFVVGLVISLISLGTMLFVIFRDVKDGVLAALRRAWAQLLLLSARRSARPLPVGMTVVEAEYRDGLFHPLEAQTLPEATRVRLTVETDVTAQSALRSALRRWRWTTIELFDSLAAQVNLPGVLFGVALVVYLATHLIGLDRFPIYFFTDEAIHTVSAIDLVKNDYKDTDGMLLPTYFKNGVYYNLSVSVYLQLVPYLIFGRSWLVTRLVSVLVTFLAAIAVGLTLKEFYKLRYWWAGTLLLSITPAWFLHSRTAFETVEFVSFYALLVFCYLLYRYRSPRYLYPTLVFAALAFYTYSPGQLIVAFTGLLLFFSDLRYHWQNRVTLLKALILVALLAYPYLRFREAHHTAPLDHLRDLGSYWMQPIPLEEKFRQFISEYTYGLSPAYWFFPNPRELERHAMNGYSNISTAVLPFVLLGLLIALKNIRSSAYRLLLIAVLVTPVGGALVGIGITRVLVMVIPAAMLAAVGLSNVLDWLSDPGKALGALASIPLAQRLGLPRLPGVVESATRWRLPEALLAVILCVVLAIANIGMLSDALINGPLWYRDYGLGGAQYGAFQVFDELRAYLDDYPGTNVIFSPSWANGTDVTARLFMGDPLPMQMGSIEGHFYQRKLLDDNTLFVMIPVEYQAMLNSGKFTDVRVEKTIPYPNGDPGFYFVRLRYVDNIDDILAAERDARRQLQTGQVTIDGQLVEVKYPMLDMATVNEMFDDNPNTVARTFEANPLVIELTFTEPRSVKEIGLIIGTIHAHVTAQLYATPDAEPVVYENDLAGSLDQPEVTLKFDRVEMVQVLRLEILDITQGDVGHIHIWDVYLR